MPVAVGMAIHQGDTGYLENLAHSKGWYNNGEQGGGADGIVGLSQMAGKKTQPIKSYEDFRHALKIGWTVVVQFYYGNTTHAMDVSFYDDRTNDTYIRDPYHGQDSGYRNIADIWNRRSFTGLDKGHLGTSFIGVGWYPYVNGAIGNVYENNREIGRPTTTEWSSSTGKAQTFQKGRIYWNKSNGKVYVLSGPIYSKWLNNRDLGDPVSGEYNSNTGKEQIFQNGRLYYDKSAKKVYKVKETLKSFSQVGFEKNVGSPISDFKNGYQQFQYGVLNNLDKSLDVGNGKKLLDVIGYNNDANIKWIFQRGVTSGTSPNTYSPKKGVTRAQMAKFISNFLKSTSKNASCFSDISNYSADIRKSICRLKELKIATGTGDNKFSPNSKVTRGQMAAFLHRVAISKKKSGKKPANSNCFADIKDYPLKSDICWMKANSVANGTSSTKYSPTSGTSRGQMATFIHNLAIYVMGEK
jgi:hypothetical protein